jgi:hypothetical protein
MTEHVVTGGLPASPPADIVDKAAAAIFIEEGPEVIDADGAYADAQAALTAIWPDIVALVAARDTDETTLRARIAEQIRANKRRWPSVSDVLEDSARIAEGAGS